jgi:hypothetical protein
MISTARSNYPEILITYHGVIALFSSIFLKKQELSLVAIFVGGMGRNEETL